MKPIPFATLLFGYATMGASAQTTLFSDAFTRAGTGNYEGVIPQNSSEGAALATSIELRSSKVTFDIVNQLVEPANNGNAGPRARTHDQSNTGNRYDFSSDLAAIGSLGSITVSFDFHMESDWLAFCFGTDNNIGATEPNIRVNHSTTDLGVFVKPTGDVQYFDNGTEPSPFFPLRSTQHRPHGHPAKSKFLAISSPQPPALRSAASSSALG